MKKRVLSTLLALTLVLSLLPAAAPHVHAEEPCTEHTYELGKYDTDTWYHYPLCDVCGYGNGYGLHEDEDSDCICDVCQYILHQMYEPEDLGDGTHRGECYKCGQTVTVAHAFEEIVWNEEKHWPVCQCGAVGPEEECVAHTFENGSWSLDDGMHYHRCDGCNYYQPEGEAHNFTTESSEEPMCSKCDYIKHDYIWDEKTWDITYHWVKCGVCDTEDWKKHSDGEDEDALCDVCGFNMACPHENIEGRYEEDGHYEICTDCEQIVLSKDPHSYEGLNYHTDDDKHYLECDRCAYYQPEGEAHSFAEGSEECIICNNIIHDYAWDGKTWDREDHWMECGNCDAGGWEDHADGEDADTLCDVCGFNMACPHDETELTYDADSHYWACTVCGQIPNSLDVYPHSYEGRNFHTDDDKHYRVCDDCDYYQPEGEAHSFAEGSDVCTVCNLQVHNYAWDGKTWGSGGHLMECGGCEGWQWEDHADGEDADALCDTCGFNMACQHETIEMEYDGDRHWEACLDCGQITSSNSEAPHSFDVGYYHRESDKHYPECDVCNYYAQEQGADHTDTNGDARCDVCEYDIHEHIYEYEYWIQDNEMHYPVCDLCDEEDRTKGEACTDTDNDHFCDVCYGQMDWLCADTDNDHICDVCVRKMTDLCVDANNDHDCDVQACQRYMWELCSAALEGDWVCDICGRNFCDHYFENMPLSNGDGTHTALCVYCGYVTEACFAWHYDAAQTTETTHAAFCSCGYDFPTEEHNYTWSNRSATGHLLVCGCSHEKWETHTTQEGICAVCELQVTSYDDVYVGGVGLKDGQYLDNSGNLSPTRPASGYAYYKDGVLELNGYVYEGHGFLWREYASGEPEGAALHATKNLILVLKGENSLQITRPETIPMLFNYGDGITCLKNLTIRGDGSLSIQVEDDGIQMDSGDVVIEGGTLTIQSGDHGVDIDGSITVTGGSVNMTAGDDGFNADGDITISGSDITIDAEDNALDSADGSVIISGGTMDLTTRDYDGIDADKTVDISGGTITIDAGEFGIHSFGGVDISGGDLEISGAEAAIYAEYEDVRISGGNLSLTSNDGAVIQAPDGQLQLPAGADPTGKDLTIQTPFSAALEADGIHLTGSPWDLTVLIAAYDESGMLIDLQLVENPGDVVTPTVTGGTVKAFFLNGKAVPLCADLPVN